MPGREVGGHHRVPRLSERHGERAGAAAHVEHRLARQDALPALESAPRTGSARPWCRRWPSACPSTSRRPRGAGPSAAPSIRRSSRGWSAAARRAAARRRARARGRGGSAGGVLRLRVRRRCAGYGSRGRRRRADGVVGLGGRDRRCGVFCHGRPFAGRRRFFRYYTRRTGRLRERTPNYSDLRSIRLMHVELLLPHARPRARHRHGGAPVLRARRRVRTHGDHARRAREKRAVHHHGQRPLLHARARQLHVRRGRRVARAHAPAGAPPHRKLQPAEPALREVHGRPCHHQAGKRGGRAKEASAVFDEADPTPPSKRTRGFWPPASRPRTRATFCPTPPRRRSSSP